MKFLFNFFFGGEIIRFVGACFLFLLGWMLSKINQTRLTYSFKEIWEMKYDNGDNYAMLTESTGQKIVGFMVIAAIILILNLLC
ncbi:hypothetical protein [Mucilaginibacter auburnensis]|uniref:Uncharacterized protein n=1 Tax=Mucilaginibacter auburnensis TaxID=1457233 RepID=A0A2H9VNC5_9SPHI|nr:hypothetical protein [Mucilaginibacter auburnensis]PJJ79829.1 hypothetical protein CLV57_2968 [Mucilaginibacter auburnensis]